MHIEGKSANSTWFVATQKFAQGSNQEIGIDDMQEINFFLAKNGTSRRFSPWQIVNQNVLDHECNCKHQFGSFVQGHDAKTPHNTVAERAVDSIHLGTTEDNAIRLRTPLRIVKCVTCSEISRLPALVSHRVVQPVQRNNQQPLGLVGSSPTPGVFCSFALCLVSSFLSFPFVCSPSA